jgi:hypothetical protein
MAEWAGALPGDVLVLEAPGVGGLEPVAPEFVLHLVTNRPPVLDATDDAVGSVYSIK